MLGVRDADGQRLRAGARARCSWFVDTLHRPGRLEGHDGPAHHLRRDHGGGQGRQAAKRVFERTTSSRLARLGQTSRWPCPTAISCRGCRRRDRDRVNGSSSRGRRARARRRCFGCSPACGRSARAGSACPDYAAVLFLPQKPYLPIGTLIEALCYPDAPDAATMPPRRARYSSSATSASGRPAGRNGQLVAVAIAWRAAARGLCPGAVPQAGVAVPRRGELGAGRGERGHDVRADGERLPGVTMVSIAHKPSVVRFRRRRLVLDPERRRVRMTDLAPAVG